MLMASFSIFCTLAIVMTTKFLLILSNTHSACGITFKTLPNEIHNIEEINATVGKVQGEGIYLRFSLNVNLLSNFIKKYQKISQISTKRVKILIKLVFIYQVTAKFNHPDSRIKWIAFKVELITNIVMQKKKYSPIVCKYAFRCKSYCRLLCTIREWKLVEQESCLIQSTPKRLGWIRRVTIALSTSLFPLQCTNAISGEKYSLFYSQKKNNEDNV